MAVLVIAAAVVGITNSRYSLATLRRVLSHSWQRSYRVWRLRPTGSIRWSLARKGVFRSLLHDV